MKNALFLDALRCENSARPPVWLMRQAGRYMPEYRALRARHSLWTLFHEPELAAEITLQPIEVLGVDAAILFSDILVIAEVFGLKVLFPESAPPQIEPAVTTPEQIDSLVQRPIAEVLQYVPQTISLLKPKLHVPLIGFCGGPFTLATYMTKGREHWWKEDPTSFHRLLQKLTHALIDYLKLQIGAGVDAIQIFDSWANLLTPSEFLEFSQAYLQKIIEALRPTKIPIILFCRGSCLYPKELSALQPAAISFDSSHPLKEVRKEVPSHIAVQGNLDPEFLEKATTEQVVAKTQELLEMMRQDRGFIANLGHGVLRTTPVANVQAFVATVKSWS